MKQTLILFLIGWTTSINAQNDTNALTFGAYADGYYSWYNNSKDVVLQQHDCIGAYHNNLGLNIAQVTSAYSGDRVRGVATLHFGDIPAITWAGTYRAIQEANAGIRLIDRLWLDVGFFKTHVGTESFLPKDNLMSIISLGTFYGPFYQSGARLSYDTKEGTHIELHAINGYNLHIDNNDYKTFGMLLGHQFGDRVFMSYSNMLGQERVGQQWDGYLVYQNIYANLDYDRVFVQLGLDVARSLDWRGTGDWTAEPLIAALATVKYHINDDFAVGLRAEMFSDPMSINSQQWVPIPTATSFNGRGLVPSTSGMTIYGGTVSLEYAPSDQGFLRIESRTLYDPDRPNNSYASGFRAPLAGFNPMLQSRTQIMATVGFYFDKTFKFAE